MTDTLPSHARPRRVLWLALKLSVAVAAVTYILMRQPLSELRAALASIGPSAVALAMGTQLLTLCLGTLRWRWLMRSYGADDLPSYRALLRVYFVGCFYNTYVPGSVGGDVLRGVVTRGSFREGGATSAVAIVFVERALGLLGVVTLAALASPFNAESKLGRTLLPYCALGALAVFALVIAVAQGRRVAHYFPTRVASLLRGLPVLSSARYFGSACLLSVIANFFVALSGHLLLASIQPTIPLSVSLLAIPIAAGASFIPLSAAGVGPRDLVLVGLYGALGVSRAAATATAFGYLITTLLVAATGGVVQLFAPLATRPSNAK